MSNIRFKVLKIAFRPEFVHPLKEGHRFPMLKYELIPLQLKHEGMADESNFFSPELASFESCCLVHDPVYVRQLFELTLDSKMVRRIGFPLTQGLIDRERYILDGTIQSANYARAYGVSFNIAGGTHHAGYDFGEGFCLINDQATAAGYLLKQQYASRILIIDLDVHQGNGTAHIFKGHQQVFTFSMHGEKNYPFIKQRSHLDIGLSDDISDAEYLGLLEDNLADIFRKFEPDFVFYQAGVDILETDKLGKLNLSISTCRRRDELVFEICHKNGIPIQVSMGGGYSPEIKDIVNAHCQTFKIAIDLYNL
ncbi:MULTISPECIES: histone deacetylase family protein [unclassified Sphingobacterium]|uniref:histone deacetylase family protein n=1 Tax=unclassified Sphingobacterium TaxID=2609468 RepID=UPI0025E81E78|nr:MULTISPECIES: histone deacetylase [unclassified Sphingobacterium]